MVLTVIFTLAGQRFCALNGGPQFKHSEAISFMIETEDQAETDRLWEAIASNGGLPGPCGWIKDRWGVSWQIHAEAAARIDNGSGQRPCPTSDAGDDANGQDRHRRARTRCSRGSA